MKDDVQQERVRAVRRFLNGEKPESICASLGRSTVWLYKWVKRYTEDDDSWSASRSKKPNNACRTPGEAVHKQSFGNWRILALHLYPRCERSTAF